MTHRLLDASVWIAARDADDRHHAAARRLIASSAQDAPLAALDLTLYEVANVAVRAWRAPDRARTLVSLVREACPGTLVRVDDELVGKAISLGEEHGLSVYDAAYVAAAQHHRWTLVSTDQRDLVKPGHAVSPADALED